MEVAGLVLGGIPLAINALQEYRSFLVSLKNAQRDLDSIIRCLRTQQRILENTCDTLLQGIVPPSNVEAMIQRPFDPLWTEHEAHIKLRLDQDWDIFQDTAHDMKTVIDDLQAKLALDDNGKPTLKDRASFIAMLKEGIRFTLRSKDYKASITALNEGNNTLRTLVSQSKELEPVRQARVRIGFIRTAQQLTGGIYNSLNASLSCSCASLHRLGIALGSRKSALIDMAGEPHASKATFEIAFGSMWGSPTENWKQFRVSLSGHSSGLPSIPLIPQGIPSSDGSSGIRAVPSGGTVPAKRNYSLMSTSTMTCREVRPAHPSGALTKANDHVSRIENLCLQLEIRKAETREKDTSNNVCLGFVPYKGNEFYLFHKGSNRAGSKFITLNEILSGDHSQVPRLDYSQKARIAYTLSSNLLPLVTTPWLERILKLDEIAFFTVEEGPGSHVYHLDQPYLARDVQKNSRVWALTSCGHGPPLPGNKYKPLSVLSLACLLVQIILGQSMEEFRITESSCLDCLMTQQAAVGQKAGAVLAKGGDLYADAVNWCLENYLSTVHLSDEEFSQRYYSTVVAKLEALVDIVGSFSSS